MPPNGFSPHIIIELVYTLIITIICFSIYFKTKESYDLTKLKGIKYFRNAFLMFGIAFILRLVISITLISSNFLDIHIPRKILFPIFLVPLGYLSTIGIFYLLFSSYWKKFRGKKMFVFAHGIALILAIVNFFTHSPDVLIYLQTILLLGSIIFGLIKKHKKKITKTTQLYSLVFISWLINLWITIPRTFIPLEIKTLLFILSTIVFFWVYRRISKWLK
jgi:hypothetical protein